MSDDEVWEDALPSPRDGFEEDEWEDVGSNEVPAAKEADGSESEEWDDVETTTATGPTPVDLHVHDWDALNAALNAAAEAKPDEPKKRIKVKRLTKEEKAQLLVQKKAHLVCLVAREATVNALANQTMLQALLRSIVPPDVEALLVAPPPTEKKDLVYLLQHLVKWFRTTFARRPYAPEARFAMDAASLLAVFYERAGMEHELVCLFTALCRGCRLATRYVVALDTPSITRRDAPFDTFFGVDGGASLRAWNEVQGATRGWLHVDVSRDVIDAPLQVEKLRGRGALLPHIVAFDAAGHSIDVAASYASQWPRTAAGRVDEVWLGQLLGVGRSAAAALDVDAPKLPMPQSAQQFRNHPQYALEKHLGVFQTLHPRKPVGVFKGAPVFSRDHVHTLRTKHQWRRRAREVCDGEVPVKRVAKKDKGVFPPPTDNAISLFGEWQTRVYEAPPVVAGVVPKNEHGNIELWSPQCLPCGAVHLQLPRVAKVARTLGVDFAPAVVGWEVKSGRNVPVLDGIVVAAEVAAMVEDAHATMQHESIEKAIKHNKALVVKRWGTFAQKLLLRKRLRDEYGSGQQG
ncbi:DNA repair protein [Achlya hypogyna]|uniref:DNA repair protein n=1 Tax=Achlya hypogyna TaxID=1202772 RepID=A0A1V9ZAU2_ACHHY|nr:DNA repair protein [Achlya hypogyna]